jgi:protein subunit release factor B
MARELLFSVTKEDFDIQTFCSGGPGGQHQNKVESGVRIIHRESGAVGESRTEKSQHTNKKIAFNRLAKAPKFRIWLNRKADEIMSGKTIEQHVEELMNPKYIKVEVKDQKQRWVGVSFETLDAPSNEEGS